MTLICLACDLCARHQNVAVVFRRIAPSPAGSVAFLVTRRRKETRPRETSFFPLTSGERIPGLWNYHGETLFLDFGGYSMKFKQFAALPYRMRDDDLEILLITTRKKRRWSVPKGWPVKDSTPQQTAAVEAYEEAGVRGAVGVKQIGQFRKRRLKKKQPVLCDVQIFPLEVKRQQGNWPEKQERSRIWVAPREAARLVKKAGLRRAIRNFASPQ
jgi:8-oxo-dGTP pyrophosphatase MutT (NUDIX family)